MARKKLIRTEVHPYHIDIRTNNKEWFPIPLEQCWKIFEHYLEIGIEKYSIEVHAFVLMGNHFHLLMSTPAGNLDLFMNFFLTNTSKKISGFARKKNHLYGSRYYWNIADTPAKYAIFYKYIYRNPVKAKICESVRNYPWSTLVNPFWKFKLVGKSSHDLFIPLTKVQQINWINEEPEPELEKGIGAQLKKPGIFKAPKGRTKMVMDIYSYLDADMYES